MTGLVDTWLILPSFLAVFALVFLVNLIGFSRLSEAIYGMYNLILDRAAYSAFLKSRNELRQAKQLLDRISAQEEFAKWARQKRLVDRLTSEFDSANSERSRKHAIVTSFLSIALRVLVFLGAFAVLFHFFDTTVLQLSNSVSQALKPVLPLFSFPHSQNGNPFTF